MQRTAIAILSMLAAAGASGLSTRCRCAHVTAYGNQKRAAKNYCEFHFGV
jgi:hypothetical protein